ncbi:MAG TPA: DUF6544 family protein, partial [Thermoanaerobaculia bacterium]|nr:DUF6544 family protein [Thermoanaerobaculia bacterium]
MPRRPRAAARDRLLRPLPKPLPRGGGRLIQTLLAAFAALLLGWAWASWLGAWRWRRGSARVEARLTAAAPAAQPPPFQEAELAGLPEPVARYLGRVLADGEPVPRLVQVAWHGAFNMGGPGKDGWKHFTARQLFVPGAPGFVWDARIAMARGVPVRVRDAFADGTGSMHGAVLGLVTVVRSEGSPELATAALQRYLGEAVWFPFALLPRHGVEWTAIDGSSARATLRAGETAVSLEFRFDADGLVASVFTPARAYDDGKNPPRQIPWQAR